MTSALWSLAGPSVLMDATIAQTYLGVSPADLSASRYLSPRLGSSHVEPLRLKLVLQVVGYLRLKAKRPTVSSFHGL